MNPPRSPDLVPVFRTTDPLEACAVADALRSSGLSVTLVEEPASLASVYASWPATEDGAIPALGSRPTLVLVPSAQRRAAIDVAGAFRRHARPSSAPSARAPGPIEGVGFEPAWRHRLLAWVVLVPTVLALAASAVQVLRQLGR